MEFRHNTAIVKPKSKKRKNMEIWRDIQSLLGIDLDNYEESIRYSNFNQKEMLKLENAIKNKLSQNTKKKNES